MRTQILTSLKVSLLALALSFGLSYVYAWTAPTVSAPGGNVSAPINTGSTAQTKTGGLTVGSLNASGVISTTGNISANLVTINSITVGEALGAYSFITMKDDESPNGVKYIHANSNVVGFLSGARSWLSYWDDAGNQQNTGAITAAGLTTTNRLTVGEAGGAYSFIAMKDDDSPTSGLKYIHANSNNIGFLSSGASWLARWDDAGNQQNTGRIDAAGDVCGAGKCLSTTGGAASIDYGNCVTITHSYGMAGLSCGGVTVQADSGDCTPYTNYVMVSDSTGLRFPGTCVAAVAKCCKLK